MYLIVNCFTGAITSHAFGLHSMKNHKTENGSTFQHLCFSQPKNKNKLRSLQQSFINDDLELVTTGKAN